MVYAVSVVSHVSPKKKNLTETSEHILNYLKFTRRRGLLFSRHDHLLAKSYRDAHLAKSVTDHKLLLTLMQFCCRKSCDMTELTDQPAIARSCTEA